MGHWRRKFGERARQKAEQQNTSSLEQRWPESILVGSPASVFWPAEMRHQDYYKLHSNKPYCQLVIHPKLKKVRREEEKQSGSPLA